MKTGFYGKAVKKGTVLLLAIGLMMACGGGDGGGGGGGGGGPGGTGGGGGLVQDNTVYTFTSIPEMKTALLAKAENTVANPYKVKLIVSDVSQFSANFADRGQTRKRYFELDLTECSLTVIPAGAFQDCTGITKAMLPDGIKTVKKNAFNYCINMTTWPMPLYVQEYEGGVFYDCWKLQNISLPAAMSDMTKTGEGASTNFSLINDGPLFGNCKSLKTVTISIYQKVIYGFQGCTSLNNVVIPANVNTVADWCFKDCTNLTKVTFERAGIDISNGGGFPFGTSLYQEYKKTTAEGGAGTYTRFRNSNYEYEGGDEWNWRKTASL